MKNSWKHSKRRKARNPCTISGKKEQLKKPKLIQRRQNLWKRKQSKTKKRKNNRPRIRMRGGSVILKVPRDKASVGRIFVELRSDSDNRRKLLSSLYSRDR